MAEEQRRKQNGKFGCDEFSLNLTAYLEGEEISDVRAHAERCSTCRSLLDDLEIIRSTAKDWPLETPSARVWSNIRATLAQEGLIREQQSFWSWRKWTSQVLLMPVGARVAALAFALILAVLFVFRANIQKNESPSPSSAPVTASVVPADLTGVQTNLVRTIRAMEENYKAREASLDPSTKRVYQEGLTSLNNSIQECLDSLQKQPHNMLVQQYLMQAYAQKAAVLASALEYGGR